MLRQSFRLPSPKIDADDEPYSSQTAASGVFEHLLSPGGASDPTRVLSNPGLVFPVEKRIARIYDWRKEGHKIEAQPAKSRPWASMESFIVYSRRIIEIAESVAAFQADCCLGALRGAAFPASLVETTTYGRATFDYFNYRNGNSKENHPRVLAELEQIIKRRNIDSPEFRIAIVDAAIGGHGITAMVPLLRNIWDSSGDYNKQRWLILIHLLHDRREGTNTKRMRKVYENQVTGRFDLNLHLHEVDSLILEDYSPAVDFSRDLETGLYKPASCPGEFILRVGDEAHRIVSPSAFRLYMEFFVEGVRLAFEDDARYRLKTIVWPKTREVSGEQAR